MFKARLLAWTAVCAGLYQFVVSDGWMNLLQFKILRMNQWAGMKEPWTFHDRLDTYYYAAAAKANLYIPAILGTDIRQLGLRLTLDAAMLGIGGLMGIAVATSCLLGAFVNFVILAPIMRLERESPARHAISRSHSIPPAPPRRGTPAPLLTPAPCSLAVCRRSEVSVSRSECRSVS